MKIRLGFLITALFCAVSPSLRAITYNDTITAIFGSDNPNSGWVSSEDNGITLGLRGKDRTTGATTNDGAGTYSFATGTIPSGTRAKWNLDWTIDTGSSFLSQFQYRLSFDTDPTQGTSWLVVDPLAAFADNSYGTASTANGAGVEGPAAGFVNSNEVAQNSWNLLFGPVFGDPNANATWSYKLEALDIAGSVLNSLSINVNTGSGGAPVSNVPDGGSSMGLVFAGLAGLVAARRFLGC